MKSVTQSKTIWAALIVSGLACLSPDFAQWISHNPEFYVILNSLGVIGLRFITSSAIKWLI